jgi:hypothetical protein
MFSLLPKMALAVEHSYIDRHAFQSNCLIVIGHHRKAKTLFEKLNQLHDDRKTQDKLILRKFHTRQRNGEGS